MRCFRSLVFQIFSLLLPSLFLDPLMCILGASVVSQVSEALFLLLSFLPLLFCSLPIFKFADSFFCCSNLLVRPPVNFLSQLLCFSTPEILSGSFHVSLLIALIWWYCSSPPPTRCLFVYLAVPGRAHGIFSLHCSMWGLQLWCVGSSAVVCGVFSCDRWGLQLWCVGSSAVACEVFSCDGWRLQLWWVGSSVVTCRVFCCGMWYPVPRPGIEPSYPCIGSSES